MGVWGEGRDSELGAHGVGMGGDGRGEKVQTTTASGAASPSIFRGSSVCAAASLPAITEGCTSLCLMGLTFEKPSGDRHKT
jgi:hypothetical protein